MNSNKSFIVLAAGGTGGHVYPALSLIKKFEDKFECLLICDERGKKFVKMQNQNIELKTINSKNVTSISYIKKLYIIILLALSAVKILFSFIKKRPSIVIGFGGYPSFPTVLAATIARIPIILHEQNAVIGQVNKFLLPFAKKMAISFKETIGINDLFDGKLVYTGNPIREEFYRAVSLVKKPNKRKYESIRILIIGGSQGAKIFSDVIPKSIKNLDDSLQKKIVITQQVRKEYLEQAKNEYNKTKCKFILKEFFQDIADLYANHDLVITRSGASTVAELMVMSIPAILVPYAAAKNNHQFYNANYLAKMNQAMLIKQKDFNVENFTAVLLDFLDSKVLQEFYENIAESQNNHSEKASDKLAELICDQIRVR